jgi:hypothetical protein
MSSSIATSYGHIGHSADVKMNITIAGEKHSVSQLGPDFLILENPVELPPSDAVLHFSIDGNERERLVRLPDGVSKQKRRVAISAN